MGLPSAMRAAQAPLSPALGAWAARIAEGKPMLYERSEEHTSELQSQSNLVCRLLLEKKNIPTRLSCPGTGPSSILTQPVLPARRRTAYARVHVRRSEAGASWHRRAPPPASAVHPAPP